MKISFSIYELAYNLLIWYVYAVFFGGWILKISGCPNELGLLIMSSLDMLPLGIWLLSNPRFRIKTRELFVDTLLFWIWWLILLIELLITSYLHQGALIPSIIHWGALVRFIPLAFVVVSISKHIDVSNRLIKHLKNIAYILLSITYISIIIGPAASIFHPVMSLTSTSVREIENGFYAAIFANTIDLAFVLVAFYTILIYRANTTRLKLYVLSLLFIFAIFKTGSAIATLGVSTIAFYAIFQHAKYIRSFIIAFLIIAIVFLLYSYWDAVELLIENIKLSRLGIISNTFPDFISEFSLDTFWGVGNDGYVVLDKVNSYPEQVYLLRVAQDGDISAFGDVYWVALLVFHGVIGLGLLFYIYYKLFRATTNKIYIDLDYDYSKIVRWLFFIIVLFAWFNQILVVKTFAIVFWIFIALTYTKITTDEGTSD